MLGFLLLVQNKSIFIKQIWARYIHGNSMVDRDGILPGLDFHVEVDQIFWEDLGSEHWCIFEQLFRLRSDDLQFATWGIPWTRLSCLFWFALWKGDETDPWNRQLKLIGSVVCQRWDSKSAIWTGKKQVQYEKHPSHLQHGIFKANSAENRCTFDEALQFLLSKWINPIKDHQINRYWRIQKH